MNKLIISVILIGLFISACSPSSATTPVRKTTPTSTAIAISTQTITNVSPTSTNTVAIEGTTLPDLMPVTLKHYCPVRREVPFEKLDINASYLLILRDIESDLLVTASKSVPEPYLIPNISPNAVLFRGVEISPDGQWFAYLVLEENQDSDNGVQLDLWISSVDGRNYYRAFADFGSHKEVRWVDDELMEIWYKPDGSRICPERILTINPFTLASTVPPDLPKMGKSVCFRPLVASPDGSKIIYPSKSSRLHSHNNTQLLPFRVCI